MRPAFGAFTGMQPITAGASERVFPIADGAVAALRSRALASAGDRRAA